MTDEFPPPPDPPDSKEPSDQDMRVQQMSRQEGLHRVTRISLGTACRLGCAASQLAEPEVSDPPCPCVAEPAHALRFLGRAVKQLVL